MSSKIRRAVLIVLLFAGPLRAQTGDRAPEPLIVTADLRLAAGETLDRPLVIRGNGIVIDGAGAVVRGPGRAGAPASFVGVGVRIEGGSAVVLRNLKVAGFALGLLAEGTAALLVEDCDFSDNQDDPEAGWNDERIAGGLRLERLAGAVVRRTRGARCWNGFDLFDCRDCVIEDGDFSHCSNNGGRLRLASGNVIARNDLSHGIRLRPGEAHARDSCGLMVESGSNDNIVAGNDIRRGGDGIFVRISSGWVSTGNRFVDNDCSHAHNHGVECWSPGNVFLRNVANHCSYGFWMGGSDRTVMIGNEAGWNGLESGNHNAPEPGFGHGGIVFVKGAAQHLRIEDNFCHDNGGPGIVVRGHREDGGVDWPFFDLLIQGNRLERNLRGLLLERGSFVTLAGNRGVDNAEDDLLAEVEGLLRLDPDLASGRRPEARLAGPARALVGERVRLDASASRGFGAAPLGYRSHAGGGIGEEAVLELVFDRPGRHRVAVHVADDRGADRCHLDVLVAAARGGEFGTEQDAARWSCVMGLDPEGKGRVSFADDRDAVEGASSLRARVDPYMGRDVALVLSFPERPLDVSDRNFLSFWIRHENPNFWGFQGPNPVVRLLTHEGFFTYLPGGEKEPRNLLAELPEPEGREGWTRLSIPLAGGGDFVRTKEGEIGLDRIQSLSLQFDSWGGEPFTIWIDGLRFD